MLFLAIPLLIYTLIFGVEINDARRWISLPVAGLTVQSSDFAKLALVAYVARFMARRQGEVHDFKKTLLPILSIILLVCLLIFPEDFSTSAVLFVTSMLVLFLGRIPLKQIGLLAGIGILVLGGAFAYVMNSDVQFGRIATMKSRIEAFSNGSDDGGTYQSRQAKLVLAEVDKKIFYHPHLQTLFMQLLSKNTDPFLVGSPLFYFIYYCFIDHLELSY
jgi:cell division protein FtsW